MPEERDLNPLVQRVDALLRRHQEAAQKAEDDVPVLTEAVDSNTSPAASAPSDLLDGIEAAALERLWPELERILDRKLQELRAELAASFRQALRQAIARAARSGADANES